ncbi:unnamed protein product [Rotaria sordida]|uniref:Uncharacterized protein n=2 Tax=Rotaria sordida TaxID=392033 RepID=A0A820AA52_9BILA|nr:unnamed protein product [Rotaria sordida]
MKSTGSDANATTTAVIPMSQVEEIFNKIMCTVQDAAKNEYQFLNNCKEFFGYEEPHKVELNKSGDCGYIIPIKKSIQNFLNKPDVIDLLIKNTNETILTTKKDKDLLLTYRDGTAIVSNKLFQKNKNSFLLQLYSDEVSVINPIGPKKDEKKLLLFYYILDDLPHIVRSLLNSIGLVGICLSKLLTNSTNRQIYFETMIKDLNTLQTEGLTLSTFTGRLYFTFNLIVADNLAANDLGGFQKNFNNGYFCRMCYISYAYKSISLTDIFFLLRSEKSHERHLHQVLQSNASIFGINSRSDFSNLLGFHSVKSLPFDIMHDFSEGVCMVIVKSILKELSVRRILTYAQIEKRLEEEDIDGHLLLNLRYEEVKSLFPKLKQRTLFMDERDKLSNKSVSKKIRSNLTSTNDSSSEENQLFIDEPAKSSDSIPFAEEVVIESTELQFSSSSDNHSDNQENDDQLTNSEIKIQEDYQLPEFPADLKFVVHQKDLSKLAHHTNLRRVLLNLIYDDVANKHNLLYPKAQDYLIITKAVLRSLGIATDDKNALVSFKKTYLYYI